MVSPESVADLVDLEQELNSLQRGITQMERITPNDSQTFTNNNDGNNNKTTVGGNSDPFGDSFTNFSVNISFFCFYLLNCVKITSLH